MLDEDSTLLRLSDCLSLLFVPAFDYWYMQFLEEGQRFRSFRALQITAPEELNVTAEPTATIQTEVPAVSPTVDDGMTPTVSSSPVSGRAETDSPTVSPMPTADGTIAVGVNASNPETSDTMCGCLSCDDSVWDALTDNTTTCGDRISFVLGQGSTERTACALVAKQFPDVCEECNPTTCESDGSDSNNNVTVVEPDTNSTETDDNTTSPEDDFFCGCEACSFPALDTITDGNVTCGDRLGFLLDQGTNETESCTIVSDQFPDDCGMCNPLNCTDFIPGRETTTAPEDTTTASPSLADATSDIPSLAPALSTTTSNPTAGFTDRSTKPVAEAENSNTGSGTGVVCVTSMVFCSTLMLLGLLM